MSDPAGSRRRVAFDAGALAFPAGGVRRYARELLRHLPRVAPDVEVMAVDTPEATTLPEGVVAGPRCVPVPTNLARAALALPWAVRAAGCDVMHAPAYTAPLWGRTPVVLTLHDVSYARQPEYYAHASGALRQWFYRRSAGRATRIMTDSTFSRREIEAAYGVPAESIAVVPLGVDASFRPASGASVTVPMPEGVREPFVLHVGDLHRRRDVETALAAVLELRRRSIPGGVPLQLVCVGRDAGSAASLRAAARNAGDEAALVLTGPVDEQALLGWYQHAAVFLYPSRYEGFGLPVLEAMACGTPVVAADAGAVPEVVGDAGVLVPAGDVRGFADAVMASLDPERRADARHRGLARAAAFTWARTAEAVAAVYREAVPPGARGRRRP